MEVEEVDKDQTTGIEVRVDLGVKREIPHPMVDNKINQRVICLKRLK